MDARLIFDPPSDGAWNMAVDEALLESARRDLPTLRFYTWREPTLSLGYFQSHAERARHVASGSCDWVRRPTGGGAILHHHELTYSFTCAALSRTDPEPTRLYHLFHESLIAELNQRGASAKLNSIETNEHPFLCFQRRAAGDVTIGPHKICGSAQRRDRGAVLIHGSVLLERSHFAPELPGICDVVAGCELDVDQLRKDWSKRLAELLSAKWQVGQLSSVERTRATDWMTIRYRNREWNERR